MNDQAEIEAILEKFRDWLEDARIEANGQKEIEPALDSLPGPPSREFGIIDLVEEFTALRHELKLQTKSGRGLIEQTENTVTALRQAIDQFRSVEPREAQAVWTAAKGLAEALADLDEAMVRGEREIDRARRQIADESVRGLETSIINLFRGRSWIRRRFLRSYHQEIIETVRRDGLTRHELFESFLEGYRLIQKRLRRALASEQVTHIPCEGKPVDPELMTVIEVVDEPRDQPGTVAKELRRGYTWRGRVIRFAEVQAVRGTWRSASAPDDDDADEMEPDDDNVETETETVELSGLADDSRSGSGSTRTEEGMTT
jgi:molecular chaperone GrpE